MKRSKAGIFTKLLTGAMIACGVLGASASAALAETRTLKLYFIHTGEKAEITFKRNGRYDADGLKKLNNFLRDWRRNEPTRMDPRLFDLVWENYRASGATGYINVVSAYRSPATNSMLRSRSKGVAEKSQHMLGKAMDFYIPGVKLKTLRDNALRLQGGGVGYYPNSGSPFVHMDVGNVRHWPGISRRELVSIFPNGKTLHVPSDGKPLPGYEQALASYKSRQNNGNLGVALASSGGGTKRSGGLLAALFGGGADEEEDVGETQVAAAPPKPVRQAPAKQTVVATAAPAPQPRAAVPGIQVISPENARRVDLPLADTAPVAESPETVVAALPARSVPVPAFAPRPQAEVAPAQQQLAAVAETPAGPRPPSDIPFGMASGEPAPDVAPTTAETGLAMANVPVPTRRPDYKPEPDQTLVALAAEPAPLQAAVNAPIPAARPQDLTAQAAAKAKAETASASQPLAVPAPAPAAPQQPETTIAALTAEEPASAFNPPAPAPAPAARVQAPAQAKPQVVAAAAPTSAETGPKTTSKAARPMAQDTKPDRKTVVVAAEPKAARWALNSNQTVVNVSDSTTAPRFAYNMVRTAPKEVYTAGFQAEGAQSDAHRFSGSAVKFLSVARFATN